MDIGKQLTQHVEHKAIYIGDGAYAMWDGLQIWVWCERTNGRHVVALEPNAIALLQQILERAGYADHDHEGTR